MHKFLKIPFVGEIVVNIYNIKLAAKYVDKIIRKFDEVFSIKLDGISTYEKFLSAFYEFEKSFLSSEEEESET